MRTRKQKHIMNCIKDNCIDMVQRYDGVYTPCWESNFEYFVNKMYSKFRNMFKRQYNYIVPIKTNSIMKELLKSAINEAFEGCSQPIDVIKRIVGAIIAISFLFIGCSVDALGIEKTICCLIVCVLLWKFLGISSAFPKDEEE